MLSMQPVLFKIHGESNVNNVVDLYYNIVHITS